ncbi:MAG: LTA synthase family protein [Deltaproteobacteria bacterium]|nr:LTA synthase family protein [Deltaproteobacteria bacterium]
MLAPAVLLVSIIFFFGPANIYLGNVSEFNVSLIDILGHYAIPGIISLMILSGIIVLSSGIYLRLFVCFMFTIGILMWIQGNIFVWQYGLLDGQGIDWAKYGLRNWMDGLLWGSFLVATCFLNKQVYKIVGLTSMVLLSLQLVYLVFMSVQKPELWKKKSQFFVSKPPPEEIFQFSKKMNVIHVILDSFQSDFFMEILDKDLDFFSGALDGFTFFSETTGSYPTTYFSVPAILSGKNYKNHVPMQEFFQHIMNDRTIPNVLYANGYDVDLAMHGPLYFKGHFSSSYNIPTPYGLTKAKYVQSKAALMLDLVLFRYAPHFLKKEVYNNQSWFFQRIIRHDQKLQFVPYSHKVFFDDLIENMTINRQKPVYKYIHLNITHSPVVMNANCKFTGKVLPRSKENLKMQETCALYQFIEFLEKLKSLGIYDGSFIILQADHGAGGDVEMTPPHKAMNESYIAGMVGSALPLMLIKPPSSKGTLRISEAQAMLSDTAATISSILDINVEFPGQSVFDIDPNEDRERRYYHHKWRHEHWRAQYFPRLDEYSINGSAFKRSSWRLVDIHFPDNMWLQTQKIDFGTEDGSEFLLAGWGYNERSTEGFTYNWALGKSATITVALPEEKVILKANVKPYVSNTPQNITVKVDEKLIGRWDLSNNQNWQEHRLVIGPNHHRPKVSILEFSFSHHLNKEGTRPLAVLFESLTIHRIEDDS